MADEKSTVKMNKMIHKKTGASFLVVYVIYVSLVYMFRTTLELWPKLGIVLVWAGPTRN